MKSLFSRLTTNQRLAGLAFVLGLVAVAARPYAGDTVRLDASELAASLERGQDVVSAVGLADWLVQGRPDLRVIDVRDERSYAEYHIPTAENVRVSALAGTDFGRTDALVLYSDTGSEAAAAWVLLKARGYAGARIIRGGLDEWKNEVLFPRLPQDPTGGDVARNAKLSMLCAHFGGHPRSSSADETGASNALGTPSGAAATPTAAEMPKPSAPKLDAAASPAKKPAKKREGC